jgi:hypothetical protein
MKGLLATLTAVFAATMADARLVDYWPYDRLAREADLIVIATPVSVHDTEERTTFPNLAEVGTNNVQHPVAAIGVETTFEILAVLKGSTNETKLVFHHLRDARLSSPTGGSKVIALNGPVNVSFEPKEKKRFLLFLRRESGGRYASVTGMTDPDMGIRNLGTYP